MGRPHCVQSLVSGIMYAVPLLSRRDENHMNDDLRVRLRDALVESYLHKDVDECVCSKCGQGGVPLAFHVIERTLSGKEREIPQGHGFLQLPSSAGYIRRLFPLCTACAPPCKKCKLPTDPLSVHKFAISVQGRIGLGICTDHIHWQYVFEGLIARILRRY